MAYRPHLISALLRAARLEAAAADPVTTSKVLLETIMRGQFTTSIGDGGRVLVSTAQAGRAVTWQVLQGLGTSEIMELAEMAWQLEDRLDGAALPTARKTKMRANFSRATY